MKKNITFIDLFAGIGGFHTAMHSIGARCVFASEWDKNARISYEANYKDIEPKLFKKNKDGEYLVSIRLNTRCSSCSVVVPLQSQ
jgi:DNA (cytosine-5)-methyltransferase 1